MSQEDYLGKGVPDRRNCQCKGPESGLCLLCLETIVAGQREGRDEGGEVIGQVMQCLVGNRENLASLRKVGSLTEVLIRGEQDLTYC